MSALRLIYLALAVVGLIYPMLYLAGWISNNGFSLSGLLAAWQANAATSALSAELAVAAVTLSVWAIAETYVRKNWSALSAIPATFLFGVGFGLPLYLFLRTRPII